ncbi:hypothetical protein L3073_17595 [Ancylomarina sp. DW003]|nr:hypothetical protein [Ancylomarina sp. DW003]MDE5424033.1 hypothetical protein [Ancylomarina sp. DW003]
MNKIIVEDGQCLLDIAIQETGSIESFLDIAKANNREPSWELEAGQVLKIPLVLKPKIGAYYKENEIKVVSESKNPIGGISYMAIGLDFKVSKQWQDQQVL